MTDVVRVGLTLPSFQSDPERVLAVAKAAEDAGIDGVFAFDHLFRRRGDASGGGSRRPGRGDTPRPPGAGERRPALELLTMTAAVAAATSRIVVGTFVARATLRPPAMLRTGFETLERIAPGRIVAGIGGGDDASIVEDRAFGVLPGDPPPAGGGTADADPGEYRLARLEATVEALAGGLYPVWVAGVSPAAVRLAAAGAGGWNRWGGGPAAFAAAVERVRAEVANCHRDPEAFTCTWGGLAVLAETAADAAAKRDRLGGNRPGIVSGDPSEAAGQIAAYAAAGAAWVIVGPIDSADPSNAAVLGEAARLLRTGAIAV